MEINRFYVELDNQTCAYFPGELITGRVISHYSKLKRIPGITITFTGKTVVHWSDRYARNVEKTFKNKEIYFCETIILIGNDGTLVTLPEGRNSFPFNFLLPDNLPSTFVGVCGCTVYSVEATMGRQWKPDKKVTVPFTINVIMDLNNHSSARNKIELKKQKNVSCCCVKSGPIGFTMIIPKRGFVPGEFIPLHIDFENRSRKKIIRTELLLWKEVTFHAKKRSRTTRQGIKCNPNGPKVGAGECESWIGETFSIPPLPPTGLENCKLIDLNYFLTLDIEISDMSAPLSGTVPIIIGTIPMRSNFQELTMSTQRQNESLQPPEYNHVASFSVAKSSPIYNNYPDLPPPTYEEAVVAISTRHNERSHHERTGHDSNVVVDVMELENLNTNCTPRYITYGRRLPE